MSDRVGAPGSAPRDSRIGALIDRFRIEAEISRGGMGVVYEAHDVELNRRVALKLIHATFAAHDSFRERFKRESRLAAQIRHPNVVAVHGNGECDGELYIVMGYVEGTDLARVIATSAPLQPARATDLVMQIANALDALHDGGLVHRDVKPANILIGEHNDREHVYLTDFGLAKHAASEMGMTLPGDVLGTPDYMAPEQVQGHAVDARTDVYALGCVLYSALTGIVPYPRESPELKLVAHVQAPPPSPSALVPGLPTEFDSVVARAMAKDPAARYPSAGDLGRAAVAAASNRKPQEPERTVAKGEAKPTNARSRPPLWRRRAMRIGAAAVAVAVALAIVVAALRSGGEPPVDVLVLIDVSMSMGASLGDPRDPGYRRIDAVRDFAVTAIDTLDHDGDRIGVWLISTSDRDLPPGCHATVPCELVPLTDAIPEVRAAIEDLLNPRDQHARRLEPNDGGTPLYRSMRGGVQTLQRDEAPASAVKSLVVISDGDADENNRPDEDDRPAALSGVFNADKPVHVFITAAGEELCGNELTPNVIKVFGGACFHANTIKDVQAARVGILRGLRT